MIIIYLISTHGYTCQPSAPWWWRAQGPRPRGWCRHMLTLAPVCRWYYLHTIYTLRPVRWADDDGGEWGTMIQVHKIPPWSIQVITVLGWQWQVSLDTCVTGHFYLLSNAAFKSAPYYQSSISIMFELSIDINVNPIVLGPPTKQAFKRNYCQIIMMSKLRNPTCRGILVTRQL